MVEVSTQESGAISLDTSSYMFTIIFKMNKVLLRKNLKKKNMKATALLSFSRVYQE